VLVTRPDVTGVWSGVRGFVCRMARGGEWERVITGALLFGLCSVGSWTIGFRGGKCCWGSRHALYAGRGASMNVM